ncbi:MAG: hypothetical protein K2X95_08500 [Flavobacteriaceae bacterium]|nr:hypothetical protein [Flavobacteriaceae bacterium]
MKKIITLLAVIGMFSFQGCTTTDNSVDNDTISTVFETKEVSFVPTNYTIRFNFPSAIYPSDMVLVYRLAGTANGKDLWEFLPETYYFDNGTRDFSYNFNFTNTFVDIYLNGNDLISVPSGNRLNQIFRIVVVPANLIYAVDKNNYPAVMAALKVNESQIQKINF